MGSTMKRKLERRILATDNGDADDGDNVGDLE